MSSYHSSLRLTPSNSPYAPFARSPTPRSPTKSSRQEEPGLRLQKVIGTTTASSNAFDCLPAEGKFAFTAGTAAVLATINDELEVTQHFFRANPSSAARDSSNGWPLSPTPGDPRNRTLGNIKDQASYTPPSSSSVRDWSESNRSLTAKDRVKAATSVAISPNGKWIALGETGYKPRVLLFSARDGSSETPTSIVAEHTFGVHALSFSPDGTRLASLGTVNDGFLYVWSVDASGSMNLVASNKCTTLIHAMSWMGKSIVTAGLRFVKVWRPDEDSIPEPRETGRNTLVTPRPKLEVRHSDYGNSILGPRHRVLAGKNSLLGDLLEATFISIIPISETKALVSAESGEVCLLDDSERMQVMTLAIDAGIRITSARTDDKGMYHAVGPDGQSASFHISELDRCIPARPTSRRQSGPITKLSTYGGTTVVAVATVGTAIVEINSDRGIRLSKSDSHSSAESDVQRRRLPAHGDAVLGVRTITSTTLPQAAFFTFSGNGTVHFWNMDGISVGGMIIPIENAPEMYGMPNELTALATICDGALLISGDKYGMVALVEVSTGTIVQQVRAHSAEILDLLAFEREGAQFLASASRDRTVQLFTCRDNRLELLQTMDEHAGAVTSLLLAQDGTQLLSCSADRTIVVRDSIFRDPNDPSTLAFGMLRCITLKSAPTSMCLAGQPDSILVSTLDRCIVKYSTKSGQPGFSFKCSDNDGGEAAVMAKVLYAPSMNGNPTIAGVSSSDKSVRLYSEYGSLIARDWGHTEGITDMAIIMPRLSKNAKTLESMSPRIVTVAADSTIFLWDSKVASSRVQSQVPESATEAQSVSTPTPLGPPLRKVISHSEITRFRRERPGSDQKSPSPVANGTPTQPPSPPKMRKKTSRMTLAQVPRLEPGFRTNYDTTRRKSLRQRSPSPPSPRNPNKKEVKSRPSLGMTLRSKSSENMLNTNATNNSFGSLTGSTESVCRTLRTYRKKLANTPTSEIMSSDALRELEKELKLTAKLLGERSHEKNISEAALAQLLDQATEKFAGLLNDQHKVKSDSSKPRDPGETPSAIRSPLTEIDEHNGDSASSFERSDTAPGALETRGGKGIVGM